MTAERAQASVVGVVGAGTMGAGIAQVALEGGHAVRLHDVDAAAVERARARIEDGLRRRAAKGGLEPGPAEARVRDQLGRLLPAPTFEELAAASAVVIEAAVEDLGAKQAIFRALDRAARPDAILATNTSALSVARIAAATARPERVLGLHFFNPAPVMKLVEVISAPSTDPELADRAAALVAGWGKTPIRCSDAPGFIVNRVNRPFTLDALRILEEGGAPMEAIDSAVTAAGFPMGPFAFMDLVGIDVNLAAAGALFEAFGGAARFRPSAIQERLRAAGHLGRKSGRGFYLYGPDGRATAPAPDFAGPNRTGVRRTDEEILERIVLSIVNEAFQAAGDGVAAKPDIDLAMRLGANHPWGPFEWADAHGLREVLARLEALSAGDERFTPAPGLRAAAEGCC